jgi:hypothetical protein
MEAMPTLRAGTRAWVTLVMASAGAHVRQRNQLRGRVGRPGLTLHARHGRYRPIPPRSPARFTALGRGPHRHHVSLDLPSLVLTFPLCPRP